MRTFLKIFSCLLAIVSMARLAQGEVKLEGQFIASTSCPALQSIKKGSNPGNVSTVPGTAYSVFAKNKDDATHYRIEIPGSDPAQRWVEVSCGTVVAAGASAGEAAGESGAPASKPKIATAKSDAAGFYILALSWQPAFCEARPDKTECKAQRAGDYETQNFALHGLWPQPRSNVFCNVSKADIAADEAGEWFALPAPDLPADVKRSLDEVMPGTQSLLERHEWIKHGTCSGVTADQYYRDSVRLTKAINQSEVGKLIGSRVGKNLQTAELRQAFDAAFGRGAGQRVRVACKRDGDRLLITEITIGLRGDVSNATDIRSLMMASTPTSPGCTAGLVDPVGQQ